MKYQQEVHNITNIGYFLNYLKKEAKNSFLIIFRNTHEFMDIFEDSFLTDKLVYSELTKIYI
jgi:hypothetical protein